MEENKLDAQGNPTIKYLDVDFQEEFIAELIIDSRFAENVIANVLADNFENEQMRSIVGIIKNFHEKYHRIPNYKELSSEVRHFVNNDINKELQLKLIENLKDYKGGNAYVQERTEYFFSQQNMLRAISEVNRIVATGDVTLYPKCEEIIRKVLVQHNKNDIGSYLFDGLEKVYDPDYRSPIPLGLPGLDLTLNGGLAPGELMLLIAPTGTGKTTLSTYVASHVARSGKKVLQIYFEDTEKQIKQKHAACLHGIEMQELHMHKETCLAADKIFEEAFGQNLILKKFKVGVTYVSTIRNYLNKLKSIGFVPDFIVLDYLDKVEPEKTGRYNSKWEGQDEVVNQMESFVDEFQVPCLTFIQSNRAGVDSERVTSKDSGGSYGRAQIVHVLGSISKTPEQKLAKMATIRIEKSRVGETRDFVDIPFDNGRIAIDIPEEMGKDNNGYLDFMIKKETGLSENDYLKEARLSIIQKRKDAEAIEDDKLVNPSVKEMEKTVPVIDSKTLENNFNSERPTFGDGVTSHADGTGVVNVIGNIPEPTGKLILEEQYPIKCVPVEEQISLIVEEPIAEIPIEEEVVTTQEPVSEVLKQPIAEIPIEEEVKELEVVVDIDVMVKNPIEEIQIDINIPAEVEPTKQPIAEIPIDEAPPEQFSSDDYLSEARATLLKKRGVGN